MAPDLAIYRIAHTAHVMLAILLSVLIALHFLATMVHALIWRDQTLARMWRVPSWFYRGNPSEGPVLLRTASCCSLLFVEFDDEVFCLCPAAKCVSGMALLCFAGGSFKAG